MYLEDPYFLGERGEMQCLNGVMIMDTAGCRNACNFLEIPLGGTFKDSKPCYKANNGKCRQDGRHGFKVFIVCENSGTAIKMLTICLVIMSAILSFVFQIY